MSDTPETDALVEHGSKYYNHPRYDEKLLKKLRKMEKSRNDLLACMKIYFHAHETGNSVPPYLVEQVRQAIANAEAK